jgi:NDP-sugar pyrophosphorylase family protein
MRAVILAGGLGTRLRPYTMILPKPLVPVGDRPILELILRQLVKAGVTRVDLCVAHLGELMKAYFAEGTTLPDELEMHWHWEDEPLGTAGALKVVPDLDETFIAMNGDLLTNLDYGALVDFHKRQDAALTIGMHRQQVEMTLGVIEHQDGLVTEYREKPTLEYDVSMGVYVYEPRALSYLPDGPCAFPELVRALLAASERVAAYENDAVWYDIGTFGEYERALNRLEEEPEVFGQ